MDKYEKCANALMELGDNVISAKKRRAAMIKRISFSVSGLCAAIIAGVGIWHNSVIKTPPDMTHIPESSIVVSETTSSENTTHKKTTTVSFVTTIKATTTGTSSVTSTSESTGTKQSIHTTTVRGTEALATKTNEPDMTEPVSVATTSGATPVSPNGEHIPPGQYLIFTDERTGIQYTKLSGELSTEAIHEPVGSQILVDEDEKGRISCNAQLFSIKNISSEVMIAVKYDKTDMIALYRNQDYKPEDLREFVDDLGLKTNGDISSAEYFDYSNGYQQRNYYGLDKEVIIEMMTESGDAECFGYSELTPEKVNAKINIICDMNDIIPVKASFGISKKGYLTTNLTGGGLAFYIGEEIAADIIENITSNYPYELFH